MSHHVGVMTIPKRRKCVNHLPLALDVLGEVLSYLDPEIILTMYELHKGNYLTTDDMLYLAKVFVPTYFPDILSLFVEFNMNSIMKYVIFSTDYVSDIAMVYATSCDNMFALRVMLSDKRFDPTYDNYSALIESVFVDNAHVIREFIRRKIRVAHIVDEIVSVACENNSIRVLRELHKQRFHIRWNGIMNAINANKHDVFTFMLRFCSDEHLHSVVMYVCQFNGNAIFLEDALRSIKSVNEDILYNAYLYACANGFVSTIGAFEPYIELNIYGGEALIIASANNHFDVVKHLTPKFIKGCVRSHQALLNAIMYDNHSMLEYLLNDPTVNPAYNNNLPFIVACQFGAVNSAERLLKCSSVDPCALDHEGFQRACEYDHEKIIKLLIREKIAPAKDSHAFMLALDVAYSMNNSNLILVLEDYMDN